MFEFALYFFSSSEMTISSLRSSSLIAALLPFCKTLRPACRCHRHACSLLQLSTQATPVVKYQTSPNKKSGSYHRFP